MNVINVIAPYKWHGMWVLDDPSVGLVQEPFVAGANTMIDRVVAVPRRMHSTPPLGPGLSPEDIKGLEDALKGRPSDWRRLL
jgi:hypothetical protein